MIQSSGSQHLIVGDPKNRTKYNSAAHSIINHNIGFGDPKVSAYDPKVGRDLHVEKH